MPPAKTVGPSFVLSFEGIELDTQTTQARLPEDKLAKCRSLIRDFVPRKKVTLSERIMYTIGSLGRHVDRYIDR